LIKCVQFNGAIALSALAALDKFGQFSDNRRQFDGAAIAMNLKLFEFLGFFGATRRIRTDDLLITNKPTAQTTIDDPAKSPTKSRKIGG